MMIQEDSLTKLGANISKPKPTADASAPYSAPVSASNPTSDNGNHFPVF